MLLVESGTCANAADFFHVIFAHKFVKLEYYDDLLMRLHLIPVFCDPGVRV